MSTPKRYRPIAASSSRRPLIPLAPVPQLTPAAHAVRTIMRPRSVREISSRLTYHAALRVFRMLHGEPEPIDTRLYVHKDAIALWRTVFV